MREWAPTSSAAFRDAHWEDAAIKLHARDGALPELHGVVQCKRYSNYKVTGDEMIVFVVAACRALGCGASTSRCKGSP